MGVDFTVNGDKLTIVIDISKKAIEAAPPSASGKTNLVASTNGSVAVPSAHCKSLALALNLMAKR